MVIVNSVALDSAERRKECDVDSVGIVMYASNNLLDLLFLDNSLVVSSGMGSWGALDRSWVWTKVYTECVHILRVVS